MCLVLFCPGVKDSRPSSGSLDALTQPKARWVTKLGHKISGLRPSSEYKGLQIF